MNRAAASLLVAVTLAGCASGSTVDDSATTVPVSAPQVAEVPTPDTDPVELSTTVVTEASQVDNSAATTVEEVGVLPEGFSTATVRITEPDGTTCDVCMWLADDAAERGRGLMGVTDLGEPVGMVFHFDELRNGNFFMFQTVTPLSIAWFDGDGVFVSATDMDPCVFEDSAQCERFPAAGPYLSAIEVFQGDLAAVGIEPGSTAVIVPGTEAERCSATL